MIERVRELCHQDDRVVAALMYGSFALVQLGLVNERVAPDALNSSVVREEVTRISQGKRRIRGRPVEKMGMLNGKDGDAQWKSTILSPLSRDRGDDKATRKNVANGHVFSDARRPIAAPSR
jgi:hypothetical protein